MIKKLNDFLAAYGLGNDSGIYIIQVFVIVFLTVLANFIAQIILKQFTKHLSKTKNIWDDALLNAAKMPITVFIWVIGISWAAEIIAEISDAVLFEAITPARKVSIIFILAWFLVRAIREVEIYSVSPDYLKKPLDETTASAMSKLLKVSIMITAALVTLQTLGYSISGVLAFGGIGGIAVGFAAKDLLANFFGSIMVYLDRPFVVGDWVRSPDKNIEGTVEHIGWRLTRIRTFDKRPLYVPNATFTSISVENPSRMTNRRIYETIGLRYDDINKLPAIISDIKAMLMEHPSIDQTTTMIINFNTFAASSLDFFIYTFTKTTNWIEYHEIKQDVLFKISEIITAHHAEIAFPTSTVHLPDTITIEPTKDSTL